jgi:threonine dehydratase
VSSVPTIEQVGTARAALADYIVDTPLQRWSSPAVARLLGTGTRLFLKLEIFQRTGTFKIRGALLNLMALSAVARKRGVTAVSAGNHAIAVACAAAQFDVSARIVMLAAASPVRRAAAEAFGAEVIIARDGATAFGLAERIKADEGRSFIHPFDGQNVLLGTGGVGLEIMSGEPDLDAIVVAIGGGGLISGIAATVKQLAPRCAVYGVEPTGADVMHRSFAAGAPVTMPQVGTIADSLAPPFTTQRVYEICRQFVDDLVTVDDYAMCQGMALLFQDAKLAVEPAAAAGVAAVLGPLRARLSGKRVAVVVCGANIDSATFCKLLSRGDSLLAR